MLKGSQDNARVRSPQVDPGPATGRSRITGWDLSTAALSKGDARRKNAELKLAQLLDDAGVGNQHDLRAVLEQQQGPHSALLKLLTHLDFKESAAARHWKAISRHRHALAARMKRDPGVAVAVLDYFQNISHRLRMPKIVERSAFEATERSAMVDEQTGLFNRRYFQASLKREVERAQRYDDRFSLVLFDVDDFKQINDQFGHVVGDEALLHVATIIRRNLRQVDIPCRFGGEEFALILPGTGRSGAYALADRICSEVRRLFLRHRFRGRALSLTLSGGVATCPVDAWSSDELVSRADAALYQAKRGGKNKVAVSPGASASVSEPGPGAHVEDSGKTPVSMA